MNCTYKRDVRAEFMFYLSKLIALLLLFSSTSPSSMLILPIIKSQCRLKKANVISLLSIPGKILEDVVCDTLNSHMDIHGLLCHKQWGFRKNYSTESLYFI